MNRLEFRVTAPIRARQWKHIIICCVQSGDSAAAKMTCGNERNGCDNGLHGKTCEAVRAGKIFEIASHYSIYQHIRSKFSLNR